MNCVIAQNTGAPLQVALSEWVNPLEDGVVVVKWPADAKGGESSNVACCVTIVGISLG